MKNKDTKVLYTITVDNDFPVPIINLTNQHEVDLFIDFVNKILHQDY